MYGIFLEEVFTDCEGLDEHERVVFASILQYSSDVRFYTDESMTEEIEYPDRRILFDTEKEAVDYIHANYKGTRYNRKKCCYISPKEYGSLVTEDCDANGYYRNHFTIINICL